MSALPPIALQERTCPKVRGGPQCEILAVSKMSLPYLSRRKSPGLSRTSHVGQQPSVHFIRSLIFSSAALAQTTSLSPPGAPLTPIAPMTSLPALITTPPALSNKCDTLANALDTGPVFERSTSSAVSIPKLAAV